MSISPRIFAFATKGTGTNEDDRLHVLLRETGAIVLAYDKSAKFKSFRTILHRVLAERPDLLVMEGTGLAGGAVCVLAKLLVGQRYVFSSGDAVGPFVGGIVPVLGPVFGLYERLLCRLSAGFIGWTPYLVGRALTFGAPRAMTAAGWSPERPVVAALASARERIRDHLGIPADAVVFGLVGSLSWNKRRRYCYGWELVRAAIACNRPDVHVLVVGDGSGLPYLREASGDRLGRTIMLPGPVSAQQTVEYMAAMDVGSLPQSLDGVGSFRYTTKISEYLAAALPIVTGQIPLAYDLDDGWLWRLPGEAPWTVEYIAAMTRMMDSVTTADIAARRAAIPDSHPLFEANRQVRAVTGFVNDLLASRPVVAANAESVVSSQPTNVVRS